MKSTKFLIQEHKLILRALDVLDAMSAVIATERKIEENDVEELLEFLRWFGDAHHQAKEETVLFPALKAAAEAQARSVEHMSLEHHQERMLIADMESDLRLNKLSAFISRADRLSSTLRNHIYKEDEILFEVANTVLDPKQDEDVVGRLNRFDNAPDKQLLEEKLHRLRILEWKYLRKQ